MTDDEQLERELVELDEDVAAALSAAEPGADVVGSSKLDEPTRNHRHEHRGCGDEHRNC